MSQTKGELNVVLDKLSFTNTQKEIVNDELQATRERLNKTQSELELKKGEFAEQQNLLKLVEHNAKIIKRSKDEVEKEFQVMQLSNMKQNQTIEQLNEDLNAQ